MFKTFFLQLFVVCVHVRLRFLLDFLIGVGNHFDLEKSCDLDQIISCCQNKTRQVLLQTIITHACVQASNESNQQHCHQQGYAAIARIKLQHRRPCN